MEGLPDYDDLVENNEYVRQRFLACHDRLVVILWGSFQKAISDLSLLYKGKFSIIWSIFFALNVMLMCSFFILFFVYLLFILYFRKIGWPGMPPTLFDSGTQPYLTFPFKLVDFFTSYNFSVSKSPSVGRRFW